MLSEQVPVAVMQGRGHGDLGQSVSSAVNGQALYSEYILKAEVEVFFDKFGTECESKRKGEG